MPSVGDTQTGPCTWCGRTVTEVYQPYPPASGVKGFYWDCSACPCGSVAGMIAYAKADPMAGRTNGYRRNNGIRVNRPDLR